MPHLTRFDTTADEIVVGRFDFRDGQPTHGTATPRIYALTAKYLSLDRGMASIVHPTVVAINFFSAYVFRSRGER